MADKAKQNAPGPHHDRFKGTLSPLVVEDNIKKELQKQQNFASTWGELIEHQDMPKSTEEAIETKKKQLGALKSSSGTQIGGLGIPLYQSAAQATMSQTASLVQSGADPEGHLKKAYRVMRAGV